MTITAEKGLLTIRFSRNPALTGDLIHFQHDTFIARWKNRELRADAYVTFGFRPNGSIEQVKIQAVSSETDFQLRLPRSALPPGVAPIGGAREEKPNIPAGLTDDRSTAGDSTVFR